MVLRGLLYSVFTLVLTTLVSLAVVGLIKITYRVIRRGKAQKTDTR